MSRNHSSSKPIEATNQSIRRRLSLKGELALAIAPTVIVLGVFALVEVLSRQRLLFASLAKECVSNLPQSAAWYENDANPDTLLKSWQQ